MAITPCPFCCCAEPCTPSQASLQSPPLAGMELEGRPRGPRGSQPSCRCLPGLPGSGNAGRQLLACGFFTHSVFCQLLGQCLRVLFFL